MTAARYRFELFVVGGSTKAEHAERNLRALCESRLGGDYELRIIDVLENAEAAEAANIVATPALVRLSPLPVRMVVGDLSEHHALAFGVGLEADPADNEGDAADE